MDSGTAAASCVAVVFDVNVYLDVAELLGEPFSWEKFDIAAARYHAVPLNGPDRKIDSLRALAVTQSGKFAGRVPLQVWTSEHIDNLVDLKASQPQEGECPEDRGLGWSQENAAALVDDLVWAIVFDKSGGYTCGNVEIPYGTPPLSHEDGLVYSTARQCCDDQAMRYCVTSDRSFRTSRLPGDITVLYPHEWVDFVRRSRARAAMPKPRAEPQ